MEHLTNAPVRVNGVELRLWYDVIRQACAEDASPRCEGCLSKCAYICDILFTLLSHTYTDTHKHTFTHKCTHRHQCIDLKCLHTYEKSLCSGLRSADQPADFPLQRGRFGQCQV